MPSRRIAIAFVFVAALPLAQVAEPQWPINVRTLAGEQALLVMDEPTAALDPAHQLDVKGLMAGLARSRW